MRINYRGNKIRKEEARRKKQEEKRLRRLNKSRSGSEQSPEVSQAEAVGPAPQL
jgi:hypothetical protein